MRVEGSRCERREPGSRPGPPRPALCTYPPGPSGLHPSPLHRSSHRSMRSFFRVEADVMVRPCQDVLAPEHAGVAVDDALLQELALGGVPEGVVGPGLRQLLQGVEVLPGIRGVGLQRLRRSLGPPLDHRLGHAFQRGQVESRQGIGIRELDEVVPQLLLEEAAEVHGGAEGVGRRGQGKQSVGVHGLLRRLRPPVSRTAWKRRLPQPSPWPSIGVAPLLPQLV